MTCPSFTTPHSNETYHSLCSISRSTIPTRPSNSARKSSLLFAKPHRIEQGHNCFTVHFDTAHAHWFPVRRYSATTRKHVFLVSSIRHRDARSRTIRYSIPSLKSTLLRQHNRHQRQHIRRHQESTPRRLQSPTSTSMASRETTN